jgi:hypothetical protein
MALQKFTISDSELSHNNWRFPTQIKPRPFRTDDEDFLVNHKIDRSYDDSTVRFKLLVAAPPITRRNSNTPPLPLPDDLCEKVKKEGWISDEYEHLWSRDGGGSASLMSHNTLIFILQTPRDGGSFSSLSLVRNVLQCGGFYCADDNYSLNALLADVKYENKHRKVPKDFAILPLKILVQHVDETLRQVQILSRDITTTELRLSEGDISLEENGDYKLLNKFNIEQLRLQRRSNFETELGRNLQKYLDEYVKMWPNLWESDTSYIDDMQEKVEQQMRYSEQVRVDLEIIPRRIKNQSKAVSDAVYTGIPTHELTVMQITNFIIQRDNRLNIEIAQSSRRIAEESRRDNLLNIELAKATAQVAEETRQDSAAMKTIAVLTLTFLPGTFIAVSLTLRITAETSH